MSGWVVTSAAIARRRPWILALAAMGVAVVPLAKVAGAPTGVVVALAALNLSGAAILLGLEVLLFRAEGREAWEATLLVRPPAQVRDLAERDAFYELGVDTEAREALDELGQTERAHLWYLERDLDSELRAQMRDAVVREEPSLIVVAGASKAGKSRTLAAAATATLADAWLLAPRNAAAVYELAHAQPPQRAGAGPCVIWLDDLEPFVREGDRGLNLETVECFRAWRRPVLLLATAGGKGVLLAGSAAESVAEPLMDLISRYPTYRLEAQLSEAERERLAIRVTPDAVGRIEALGEFMVAAPGLFSRLERDPSVPEGQAVVRAAIDWCRAGLPRPIPQDVLEELHGYYLSGPASKEGFHRGLAWALEPLYSQRALLARGSKQVRSP
jgi:hypothetical protein